MYRKLLVGLVCLGLTTCSHSSAQQTAMTNTLASAVAPLALSLPVTQLSSTTAAIAVASLPSLNTETFPYELLQARKYHGDEVLATSGEQWWGLFITDNGVELLPTTITVNTIRDPFVDLEEGEFTGKEVVTDNDSLSVFLVKGPDFLEPGTVKTVFSGAATIPNSQPQAGRLSSLSLIFDADEASKIPIHHRFSLTDVSSGETLQAVLTFSEDGEGKTQKYSLENCCDWTGPSLLWAGDLDRDGKLDFLLDTSRHYNVSEPTLFLSSLARTGELGRPVARQRSVGS